MANNELDRLRSLASFADQICSMSDSNDDARRRINHLILRAEQDIKAKSLEIQLQQSHIMLLKHLDGFMTGPAEAAGKIHLNEPARKGPRAIVAEGS